MKLKEIKKILKMDKYELLNYAKQVLEQNGYKDIIQCKDYVYTTGEIPILLVAHCDTVHKKKPQTILFDSQQQMMWSPEGIGGDDRCGVLAIFEIIKEHKPYILFTQDEEIGGLGVKQFCKDMTELPVKFALEIDRRGNNQAVFYDCGNKDLQSYICDDIGFDLEYGTFTDVVYLGEMFDIGIVNVSAGYYNEHQNIEFIYFPALFNSINKVKQILKQNDDIYYDYQEVTKTYNYKCYDKFDIYDNYTYMEEYDFDKLSNKEWFDLYGYKKPKTKKELYKIIFDY